MRQLQSEIYSVDKKTGDSNKQLTKDVIISILKLLKAIQRKLQESIN